jgi:hypothetical protein
MVATSENSQMALAVTCSWGQAGVSACQIPDNRCGLRRYGFPMVSSFCLYLAVTTVPLAGMQSRRNVVE